MDERILQIQNSMYQYSRAIYRSIKDLIDPYVDRAHQLEYRREVLAACEGTMERLAADPHYFAKPDRALFQDIRRYFPITVQAQVAWSVNQGVGAAVEFIEEQIEPARSRAASRAATRRRARASRASARRCPSATTARRISISTAPSRRLAATAARSAESRLSGLAGCKLGEAMSHDTDKLIRQLSLVAFLMAELRPLTARDIKGNVEGYQEMSDEAFARRFYSDRAELVGLGVPLDSQRDEFTGEELYTLRSERYFLPPLDLDDDELAALQTCLYLLEGRSPTPSRCGSPCRTWPSAARPACSSAPRRRPPCGSRSATRTTRRSSRAGSASSRPRSRNSGRCASATGRSRGTTSASGRSTRMRCCRRTAPGT